MNEDLKKIVEELATMNDRDLIIKTVEAGYYMITNSLSDAAVVRMLNLKSPNMHDNERIKSVLSIIMYSK